MVLTKQGGKRIFLGLEDYVSHLGLVFLVNLLTNPAAVLCYYFFTVYTQMNVFIIKIPIELVVILIESLYYRKYASFTHKPFLFSALANIFSFGTGLILNTIF